uniref:Uncharacterized protein n=1 Tax=Cyanistes caeruleus TaxID=156563 RepID=A0A8C0U6B6_CYACU
MCSKGWNRICTKNDFIVAGEQDRALSGTQLVTSSGDTTVRIWDLSRRGCILTLRGHSRAVRACSWHSCGDFVASASMDGTSKVWDVNSWAGEHHRNVCPPSASPHKLGLCDSKDTEQAFRGS